MKVVLERLERNEQEEAEEEAVWSRLTTPERRLSNYSFGLPWLLIDYMLRLRVHAADKGCSVGMFSPGFWLGMDVAFSGGGGGGSLACDKPSVVVDFHTCCLVGTYLKFWKCT